MTERVYSEEEVLQLACAAYDSSLAGFAMGAWPRTTRTRS